MWKMINSPIVITIIAIITVFVLRGMTKPKLASEIRGAYEELVSIVEDGASDAEKSMAIKEFAEEISKQFREGFSAGLGSGNNQKNDKDKIFVATKQKVQISDIKYVKSKWQNSEEFMFVIKNNSDKYIAQLKLNYEYHKGGKLIACENDWVSEIKLLEPNQEIAINHRRQLPEEEGEDYTSDEIKIKVTSFDVKEV